MIPAVQQITGINNDRDIYNIIHVQPTQTRTQYILLSFGEKLSIHILIGATLM